MTAKSTRSKAGALDDIRNQVMWARLIAVVEEQARTLMSTAFSSVVRESGDLSAGVFDRRGRMVAQAVTGTPGHVNSMALAAPHFLERFPIGTMAEGDHYITNDPWMTSGHLHDVTVMTPVHRGGTVVALFACTCHQVDIGGLGQGPDGRSVFEEGLYIPLMKLADRGTLNEDLFTLVRGNVRTPLEVEGDILSYVTSNETGARRLLAMMDEFGLDDIEGLADFVIDNSRAATEAAIAGLPRGTFRNTLTLDGYDKPVTLRCAVTLEDRRVLVDFEGSSPASPYGINVVLNYCKAYAAFGVRTIVAPDVPNNAGSLAPVEVRAPAGSIVNVERPWPVAARHIIGQFLPDVVLGALAKAVPEKVPAEGAACLWGIQIRGGPEVAARVGRPGGNVSSERYEVLSFNSGGSGARPGLDGMSATAFPSGVRAMSSELFETLAPIVVWRKELRADSGGAGETRGGLGQTVEVGTLDGAPFALYAMFDRVENPAKGRGGGANGAAGKVRLASGKPLPAKGMHYIPGDDHLVVELPGGGGRGKARKRDPAKVAADVADGYVTRKSARAAFGVALKRGGSLDTAATQARRAAMRSGK